MCFDNEAKYKEYKEKLPSIIQAIPLYVAVDGFKATATAKVSFSSDGKIKFDIIAATIIGPKVISEYVGVCVDDKKIEVTYKNGKMEVIEVVDEKNIKVQGVSLAKVSDHNQYIAKQADVYRRNPDVKKIEDSSAGVSK